MRRDDDFLIAFAPGRRRILWRAQPTLRGEHSSLPPPPHPVHTPPRNWWQADALRRAPNRQPSEREADVARLQQRFSWWLSSRSARRQLLPSLRAALKPSRSWFGSSDSAKRQKFYAEILARFEERVSAPHALSILSDAAKARDRAEALVLQKLELYMGPHLDRLKQLGVGM